MKIEVQLFNEKELEEFVNFSKTYYQSPKTNSINAVRHKFQQIDNLKSFHIKAYDNDKLIGRVVLNEKKLHLGKKDHSVTHPTDLLTLRNSINPLTAISLVRSFNKLNTDLVMHTSNKQSDIIYKSLFKFPIIFKCVSYGFPLKPISLISIFFFNKIFFFLKSFDFLYKFIIKLLIIFFNSFFNSIELKEYNPSDILENELIEFKNKEKNLFSRSKKFIKWRYLISSNKSKCYQIVKKNINYGYLFCEENSLKNLKAFCITDFILLKDLSNYDYFSLKINLIHKALFSNNDLIFFMGNKNNRTLSNFFKFPFIYIRENYLPHSTPIYVSSVKKEFNINDCRTIYFTLSDTDYF